MEFCIILMIFWKSTRIFFSFSRISIQPSRIFMNFSRNFKSFLQAYMNSPSWSVLLAAETSNIVAIVTSQKIFF